MVCLVVQAQSLQVSGTIVSKSDGQPVIGATILEQGTTNGTITDFDGKFSLTVKQGAEISISYIGFKTQVVKAQNVLDIVLEEDTEVLDEVVVTGYTTQRKADLTGAVSVVSMDDLSKQNENNPMKALQGRVPGMNITADGNPSVFAHTFSRTSYDGFPFRVPTTFSTTVADMPTLCANARLFPLYKEFIISSNRAFIFIVPKLFAKAKIIRVLF